MIKNLKPMIKNQYKFDDKQKEILNDVRAKDCFDHTSWGNEDLKEIRSSLRNHYRKAQKGKCAFCLEPLSLTSALNAQVEHIVPKSLHLDFIFETKNLCVICADCNEIKRKQETLSKIPNTITNAESRRKYPRSNSAFKIVHPHFDNYKQHIIKRGRAYIDKSKKGRFTISVCKLNRYFHQFGYENDHIEEAELMSLFQEYIECKDSVARKEILQSIKDALFLL